jgi:glycosyltransferase involved in cell wall biosynthesis
MRILLSTLSLDAERGGGTAQRTRFLARHLTGAGASCQVVSMENGDLAAGLRNEGIPVYATGALRIPYHVPLLNMRALDRLVRDADVLHLLGYWNLLSVALAWLARRRGKPYVLSAAGEFAALHSGSHVKRAFHALFGSRMIAGASAIITITARERAQVIEWLGLPQQSVIVLPNGVEPVASDLTHDRRIPEAPFVLFMGRLAPIKGPDLLIEAFAAIAQRHKDVALVVAGPDGGLLDDLQKRRATLGLEKRVVFTGYLDEAARRDAYQRTLLLVVPSRDEAMSLVALEAGVLGRPVLLTERCGFDEAAEIGGGLTVPATVEGLRDGLDMLLSNRAALSDMGAKLQTHVVSHYSWPALSRQLLASLREMTTGPSR